MKRLAEIMRRIQEIEVEVRNGNVSDALNTELDALLKEKKEIETKQAAMQAKFEEGRSISAPSNQSTQVVVDKRSLKIAFAKRVRGDVLSETETRMLEKSYREAARPSEVLTTTDKTYQAPSELGIGINNGGLFIPEELVLDILKSTELTSSFAKDCLIRNLKGVLKFPYKKSNSGAKATSEMAANAHASIEWAMLELTIYNQTITIPVTYELEAQAIEGFADYLMDEIAVAVREAINEDILYGTGLDNHLTGATIDAIPAVVGGYDSGKEVEALETAIRAIPKRKKQGAKIYVATDLYNTVIFAKDTNGDYIFNPFNSNELKTFATKQIEEDETLKDGDFIVGNPKHMILNLLKGISIETERHPSKRLVEYSSHVMLAGKPEPSSFVYGFKKVAAPQ